MVLNNRQIIQITGLENGIMSMIPVTFNGKNWSVADIVVHSSVIGHIYRPTPLYYSTKEDFIRIINNKAPLKTNKNYPNSLRDLIFPADIPVLEFGIDYLNWIYDEFIENLNSAYTSLKERTKNLKDKFFCKDPSLIMESNSPPRIDGVIEDNKEERIKWISQAKACHNTNEVTEILKTEISNRITQLSTAWNCYLETIITISHPFSIMLLDEFNKARTESFQLFSCTSRIKPTTISDFRAKGELAEHKKLIKNLRKSINERGLVNFPLKDVLTFSKLDEIPIMIEDVFLMNAKIIRNLKISDASGRGCLFVLSHGYLSSSYDTHLIRNVIMLRFPKAHVLCAADNDGRTEGMIENMGKRLANEVLQYIKEEYQKDSLKHLSFIGHSLGGLIIRSALPYLEEYKDKMEVFLTLSTPHLGCMYQSSNLVGAGMWFMKKWRDSKALEQLTMTDNKNPTETYLYKLSESTALEIGRAHV